MIYPFIDLIDAVPCRGILRQAVPYDDVKLIARRGKPGGPTPKTAMNGAQSSVFCLLHRAAEMMLMIEEADIRSKFSIPSPSWRGLSTLTQEHWQTMADAHAADLVALVESWEHDGEPMTVLVDRLRTQEWLRDGPPRESLEPQEGPRRLGDLMESRQELHLEVLCALRPAAKRTVTFEREEYKKKELELAAKKASAGGQASDLPIQCTPRPDIPIEQFLQFCRTLPVKQVVDYSTWGTDTWDQFVRDQEHFLLGHLFNLEGAHELISEWLEVATLLRDNLLESGKARLSLTECSLLYTQRKAWLVTALNSDPGNITEPGERTTRWWDELDYVLASMEGVHLAEDRHKIVGLDFGEDGVRDVTPDGAEEMLQEHLIHVFLDEYPNRPKLVQDAMERECV